MYTLYMHIPSSLGIKLHTFGLKAHFPFDKLSRTFNTRQKAVDIFRFSSCLR